MKIIYFVLILLLSLNGYSQELKSKKLVTNQFIETFTVDKKSKLKNGNYVKISAITKDTLATGNYRDDLKTGIWKYYRKGNAPWIIYDYENKAIKQLPTEITKVDSFLIWKDNAFVREKVDSPPVYVGFEKEVQTTIAINTKLPVDVLVNGLLGKTLVSFIIDKTGKMNGFRVEASFHKDLNPEVLNACKLIDGIWQPAKVNGQPVDSKLFVIIDVVPPNVPSQYQDTPNIMLVQISYFGVKRTSTQVGVMGTSGNKSTRRY
ncbi:MAG: hypothetical protein WCP85_29170 [Mariniphaga sp.]